MIGSKTPAPALLDGSAPGGARKPGSTLDASRTYIAGQSGRDGMVIAPLRPTQEWDNEGFG
jgi:hypothetical protein